MSDPERRRAKRIALKQDVSLVVGDGEREVAAVIENFSAAGVLLYAGQLMQVGSGVGFSIVVPPLKPEMESPRMWCFGKIVRVEQTLKEGKFGMAVGFQRFEQVPEA